MKCEKIIAYDLGTGGIKASLFEVSGKSLANTFSSYDTVYTGSAFHEQDPDDWWRGILKTTTELSHLARTPCRWVSFAPGSSFCVLSRIR